MGTESPAQSASDENGLPELDAYDFALPDACIAQEPIPQRDAARMLVLDHKGSGVGPPLDQRVHDLVNWLREGDLLVVNRTKVVAAKLRGRKRETGGQVEALLLSHGGSPNSRALLKAGRRVREGMELVFEAGPLELEARVERVFEGGEVELAFDPTNPLTPYEMGEPPLPPYIRRNSGARDIDRSRYQTVFADQPGAAAAPTAGLHLTSVLLHNLTENGVELASVVLHVGLGTFKPLRREDLDSGRLHRERYELPEATAQAVKRTRARGGRVIAVGTTTTRVLESCASAGTERGVDAGSGETDLFIQPGKDFPFRVVDGLLTNFHLPRSSLLLLVCGFAGRERVLSAYREAIGRGYRFYSYGDAMLLL